MEVKQKKKDSTPPSQPLQKKESSPAPKANEIADKSKDVDLGVTEDELQCVICLTLLYKPITFVCGHKVCSPCFADLRASTAKRKLKCPTCRGQMPNVEHGYDRLLDAIIQKCFKEEYEARDKEHREKEKKQKANQQPQLPLPPTPTFNFGTVTPRAPTLPTMPSSRARSSPTQPVVFTTFSTVVHQYNIVRNNNNNTPGTVIIRETQTGCMADLINQYNLVRPSVDLAISSNELIQLNTNDIMDNTCTAAVVYGPSLSSMGPMKVKRCVRATSAQRELISTEDFRLKVTFPDTTNQLPLTSEDAVVLLYHLPTNTQAVVLQTPITFGTVPFSTNTAFYVTLPSKLQLKKCTSTVPLFETMSHNLEYKVDIV